MALSSPKTYVQTLINAGSDVMSNLYYLKFDFGPGLGIDDNKASLWLKVRNSEFRFDGFTQTTDQRHYMTTSLSVPKPEITGSKTLNLSFRVDANYELYKYVMKLWSVNTVANFAFAGTNVPAPEESGSISLTVYGFKGPFGNRDYAEADSSTGTPISDGFVPLYKFTHCYIKNVTGLNFSYDGSTPETLQVTLNFFDFKDYIMSPELLTTTVSAPNKGNSGNGSTSSTGTASSEQGINTGVGSNNGDTTPSNPLASDTDESENDHGVGNEGNNPPVVKPGAPGTSTGNVDQVS